MREAPSSPDWKPFVYRRPIGWGDTDAARIVYTGRFADFALEAIEGWFRDRLGTDWYRLNVDERIGSPFVHLSLDFERPVTPRDAVDVTVLLRKAGRSSLTFAFAGASATGAKRLFHGKGVCVFVDTRTMKSTPVPDRYRPAVEREAAAAQAVAVEPPRLSRGQRSSE